MLDVIKSRLEIRTQM